MGGGETYGPQGPPEGMAAGEDTVTHTSKSLMADTGGAAGPCLVCVRICAFVCACVPGCVHAFVCVCVFSIFMRMHGGVHSKERV